MKGKRRGVIWCIAFLFILYLGWRFLQYEESEEIIEMSEAEKMEYWKSSPLWVWNIRPSAQSQMILVTPRLTISS